MSIFCPPLRTTAIHRCEPVVGYCRRRKVRIVTRSDVDANLVRLFVMCPLNLNGTLCFLEPPIYRPRVGEAHDRHRHTDRRWGQRDDEHSVWSSPIFLFRRKVPAVELRSGYGGYCPCRLPWTQNVPGSHFGHSSKLREPKPGCGRMEEIWCSDSVIPSSTGSASTGRRSKAIRDAFAGQESVGC